MNQYIYLYFIVVILAWSLPSFVSKNLTKYMDNVEIFIYYHIIFHLLIISYIIYTVIYNRKKVGKFSKSLKSIPFSLWCYTILIVLLILTSRIFFYELLRTLDVNTILPIIRGGSTIVVVAVGYLLFKEKISFLKLVGIFTVLLGIYIVNKY